MREFCALNIHFNFKNYIVKYKNKGKISQLLNQTESRNPSLNGLTYCTEMFPQLHSIEYRTNAHESKKVRSYKIITMEIVVVNLP